jgi:hypothetical protein
MGNVVDLGKHLINPPSSGAFLTMGLAISVIRSVPLPILVSVRYVIVSKFLAYHRLTKPFRVVHGMLVDDTRLALYHVLNLCPFNLHVPRRFHRIITSSVGYGECSISYLLVQYIQRILKTTCKKRQVQKDQKRNRKGEPLLAPPNLCLPLLFKVPEDWECYCCETQ